MLANHASIRLVADTSCIEELVNLALQHKPDVILVDLLLNNGNCIEHISKLLNACPQSKVLAFSHQNNENIYLQTFRAGAVGIISKHHSSELLLKAIYAIHAGQVWYDRHITKLLWQAQFDHHPDQVEAKTDARTIPQPRLSDSERHIAFLACRGLSAKQISTQL